MRKNAFIFIVLFFYPLILIPQNLQDDPAIWVVKGEKEYEIFNNELKKQLLNLTVDEDKMFTALRNTHNAFCKADMLAQKLEDNGMGNNLYVDYIADKLQEIYQYFVNAGTYYYNEKEDFLKASEYFEIYWNYQSLRIFSDPRVKSLPKNGQEASIKYFAAICAIKAEDSDRSIRLLNRLISEPYIPESSYKESDPYELLSEEYRKTGDKDSFIQIIKTGMKKFPDNKYFLPTLINEYIIADDYSSAIELLDNAVKKQPDKLCEYTNLKAILLVQIKEYKEAEKAYKQILKKDPGYMQGLQGLGVLYALMAQDINEESDETTSSKKKKNTDKNAISTYNQSLSYLNKYYESAKKNNSKNDLEQALSYLQHVYHNLNSLGVDKEKELEKVEKELLQIN